MGRRNEHSREQQREMAIAAAELILVREGFSGLSMRKVADAIGYTVGNLYLLFENQDDLLATVNERTTDAVYAHLRDAIETAAESPEQQLRALANAYIDFARAHPHRFRMLFEHQLPDSMKPRPSAEQRIRRMFELVEATIAPLFRNASRDRLRLSAATLWSSVHGICMLAATGKLAWSGRNDYRPFTDHLIATFLAGLSRSRS